MSNSLDSVIITADPVGSLSAIADTRYYSQWCVVVDEHTRKYCYEPIAGKFPPHHLVETPAGEANKNIETCLKIWGAFTDYALDRHALVIIIGGGVLGDMAGFCAATYKRGVDFVLVPTTLLAQVDASIGGKLGIDFRHFKNHLGVFTNPLATIISSRFLKTLPVRELRSGFAEVIKHCLIADKEMWKEIRTKPLDQQDWDRLLRHSVAVKSRIVHEDPREAGIRKVLNFGHTIGHAIETASLESNHRLFHGEAIAIGMVAESHIAHGRGWISTSEYDELIACILSVFGKERLPGTREILSHMLQDKKNMNGKIRMALLQGIGKAIWDVEVTNAEIEVALKSYDRA